MANLNIKFNNTNYEIPDTVLASTTASLKSHLTTNMNGEGATIEFGGVEYSIDSTKLSEAMNSFVSHLGTIAGSGSKVTVNGVEYSVSSDKIEGAFDDLTTIFDNLQDSLVTYVAGIYSAGAIALYEEQGAEAIGGLIVTSWDKLLSNLKFRVEDGVLRRTMGTVQGDLFLPNDNSITSIASNTFSNCTNLKGIVIPESVTSISDAFADCTNLTSIKFEGTMAQWHSIAKDDNWSLDIPATYVQCSDGRAAL